MFERPVIIPQAKSGGTDWSKYTPQSFYGDILMGSSNIFDTILEISGKGYVKKAVISGNNGGINRVVRITIDNVIVIHLQAKSTVKITGMLTHECINYIYTTLNVPTTILSNTYLDNTYLLNSIKKNYPITDVSEGIVLLSQSVFFNSNFKIEAKDTTHGGTTTHYGIDLGVIL